MPPQVALRLNMTGLRADPREEAERYRAALDMAVYAERSGFDVVNLEEHHCAENGWLPAPLTLAAMVAARTERIRISVTALLVTLYDPVRLAEDIAVIDLVSRGRFSFTAGMGYRPIEYHATGRSWAERGRLMDEAIETLLAAWTGEPFDYRGDRIRVTPKPFTQPHPMMLIGGQSPAAARRAARFGLPFHPPMHLPALEAVYREELARLGRRGFYLHPGAGNAMTFVEPDPERAWTALAPYFLHELREYAAWRKDGVPRPGEEPVETVADLRRQKRFEIVTPAECRASIRSGERGVVVLHPLAGGIPVERAWEGLRRFTDEVLAPLRAESA